MNEPTELLRQAMEDALREAGHRLAFWLDGQLYAPIPGSDELLVMAIDMAPERVAKLPTSRQGLVGRQLGMEAVFELRKAEVEARAVRRRQVVAGCLGGT